FSSASPSPPPGVPSRASAPRAAPSSSRSRRRSSMRVSSVQRYGYPYCAARAGRYRRPMSSDGSQAPAAVVAGRALTRPCGSGDTAVDGPRGVSLDVTRGELNAIMGPSGSGKSTLMHILAGLDRPTSGDVWIDGIRITELADNDLTRLRREHIGFVFQFFN